MRTDVARRVGSGNSLSDSAGVIDPPVNVSDNQ
jgi:hypothetical protein